MTPSCHQMSGDATVGEHRPSQISEVVPDCRRKVKLTNVVVVFFV